MYLLKGESRSTLSYNPNPQQLLRHSHTPLLHTLTQVLPPLHSSPLKVLLILQKVNSNHHTLCGFLSISHLDI